MANARHIGASAQEARAICLFLHGRGQTPDDMIASVVRHIDMPDVRFVLPKSPREAWYDARAVDPLTPATIAHLDEALALIDGLARVARSESAGVPFVIAAFSQGACLSIEYLMRGGKADAAVLFTGCRVGAVEDGLPASNLSAMPVYHSNGDADPWVPLWASQKAVAAMAESGARLRCDILPGRPHEVSATEIAVFASMLDALRQGRRPFGGST